VVCDTNKEALLIYIVGIARVNVVLLYFRVQYVKVQLISFFRVSLVLVAIVSSALFNSKLVGIAM
jgi:hypothetical protein